MCVHFKPNMDDTITIQWVFILYIFTHLKQNNEYVTTLLNIIPIFGFSTWI